MPEPSVSLGPPLGTRDGPGTGDLGQERPFKGTPAPYPHPPWCPYFFALGCQPLCQDMITISGPDIGGGWLQVLTWGHRTLAAGQGQRIN